MAVPVYIKPVLVLLVMVAVVSAATMIYQNGSRANHSEKQVVPMLPTHIDVVLKDARFAEIQDGHVVWELAADKAEYDKTGDNAYLTKIRLVFRPTATRGEITVTADKGVYSAGSKTIQLVGHVNAEMAERGMFKTSQVFYSGSKERFTTDEPVSFVQQRLQLTAVGMDFSIREQQIKFRSDIEAAVAVAR